MSYPYHLSSDSYDGQIGGIRVRWQESAVSKLVDLASESGVSLETIKALTEYFVYNCASRLESDQAIIR